MKSDEVYEYNDYELLYMIRAKNETALLLLLEKYKDSSGNMIRKYFGKTPIGIWMIIFRLRA